MMTRKTNHVELAIVGSGPAGLSAALEAAGFGVEVLVIDESTRPGGQYYRQFPDAFHIKDLGRLDKAYKEGHHG